MDPKATLEAIRDAIQSGQWEEAAEFAGYLRDWLRRGGFIPEELGPIRMVRTQHGRFPVLHASTPC